MQSKLFIISGPSGSGKDSVVEGLRNYFEIERVVTTTARKPRPDESQGHPYYFISPSEFEKKINNSEMAEWAKEDNDQYYGVTIEELERVKKSAKIGIWRIGYKGVITVKKMFPEIVAILINTDLATLEKRIRRRDAGASEEYIRERMEYTREWLKHKSIYDYEVTNTEGKLDEAIAKTAQIIQNTLDEQQSSQKIQNFSHQNDLWKKGDKVVLAVSGGPDSVCLLDVFAKFSKKYNLSLHLAHVNYGLRGKDSFRDEQLVQKLAQKYQLSLSVYQPTLVLKGNLEEQLRNLRYEFFQSLVQNLGYDWIAVGHNLNDQAETVLMRVIRGTGLQGLRSIQAKNGLIIRPLLEVSRSEILEYLKQNKLPHRQDRSNADESFLRNRVRKQLLPLIEKEFNPAIRENLYTLSRTASSDYDYLGSQAKKLLKKTTRSNDFFLFDRHWFLELHPALRRELLRKFVAELRRSLAEIESSHLQELEKAIRSTKSKQRLVIFKGLRLRVKNDTVELGLNK